MDHDVASYDRPYNGGTNTSFEDEPTEIGTRVPARRKPPVAKIPLTAKLPRAPAAYASPSPVPARVSPPRVAVPHPLNVATAAAHRRPTVTSPPAPVRRRWSARTLAMFGAGMGTAGGMLVAVTVLLALAVSAPTGGGASKIAMPETPEGVGWVGMVTAVGTTLFTGRPAVSRPEVEEPAAPVVAAQTAPAEEPASVLTAMVEPTTVSAPPVVAAPPPAAPVKKSPPSKPSRTKKPRPQTVAAASAAPAAAPAAIDPWAAPPVGVMTEVDPWTEPVLPVEPIVGGGEGMATASAPTPAAAPAVASAPAPGPEVDLLEGDDGLGQATEYTFAKPTLAGFGEAPAAPDQEAISDLQTIQTRVVRIEVEGASPWVEVDGRSMGTAPVALDLAAGSHVVTLSGADGKPANFELEATADLGEWCFESRGKTFGQVRCE